MKPSKRFIFGFTSPLDLLTTILKIKSIVLALCTTIMVNLAYVAGLIYDPYEVVYLLVVAFVFDWLTGTIKAVKRGTFNSYTFQRMLLNIPLTLLLVAGCTWAGKHIWMFSFFHVDEVIMTGFLLTSFISICENLNAIDERLMPREYLAKIRTVMNVDTLVLRYFQKPAPTPEPIPQPIESEVNPEPENAHEG